MIEWAASTNATVTLRREEDETFFHCEETADTASDSNDGKNKSKKWLECPFAINALIWMIDLEEISLSVNHLTGTHGTSLDSLWVHTTVKHLFILFLRVVPREKEREEGRRDRRHKQKKQDERERNSASVTNQLMVECAYTHTHRHPSNWYIDWSRKWKDAADGGP